jgi:DNA (cytosine-5)-methyltransferase 3A
MGCKPVEINSMRFVPQNRPRLYWTNIPIKDIEDVDCCLSDILLPDETEFLDKFKLSEKGIDYMSRLRNGKPRWDYHTNPLNGNAACLTANMYKGIPYGVIKEKMRRLHPIECERLQGVPDNYTDNVSNTQRLKAIGNGWTVNVIRHIFEGLKPVKKKVNKKLNVLSLFDGMSCGQIALGRAGIDVENYYSSEIDKHAIKETMINYPDTIQVGDVTKIVASDLPKIDLLIGGSPCQGFSFSGKQLNFEDPRSKLFFEFVRLLKECEPTYFLLENVVMKKEYEQVITDYLGVEPIQVNSTLVSAQNRVRLYWTNIPNVGQPDDKNITLMDILEDDVMIGDTIVRPEDLNKGTILGRRLNKDGKRDDYNKTIPIVQCLEVRASNRGKSNCITTVAKDNVLTTLPIGRHVDAFNRKLPFRYYTTTEYCRLQTVPDDYFKVSSDNQIRKMIGNGWTVDVIAHIFNGLKE